MEKSPFSTAGGGGSDSNPHGCAARKRGGRVKCEDGGSTMAETKKEASGKKSIGFVDGEDAKPRLDRKRGGGAKRGRR
jgi:hypothetical protein